MSAHDPLQKLEDLLNAVDDVVTDLAGRPPTDADAHANHEAVLWIRRALEDISATCAGIHLSSGRDRPKLDLRATP